MSEKFFKDSIDETEAYQKMARVSLSTGIVFLVISAVACGVFYFYYWERVDVFGKVMIAAIPVIAVYVGSSEFLKRKLAVLNGPVLKMLSIEGDVLISEVRCQRSRKPVIERNEVQLDSNSKWHEMLDGFMVMPKDKPTGSVGNGKPQIVAVVSSDFIDEEARERFAALLVEKGVECVESHLNKLLMRAAERSKKA